MGDTDAVAQLQMRKFPLHAAVPKQETQAQAFLDEHPEYDGRGVVVAIFDTGVDPGAIGLQACPDGRPKVIDVVECTGSGDVDMSTVVSAEDNQVRGATGRQLKLNSSWVNPSGKWHVGAKHAFELYPAGALRDEKQRRAKARSRAQQALEAAAINALSRFEVAHPGVVAVSTSHDALEREKAELEGRLKTLQELEQGYEDLGPVLDCVVYHDGDTWRAAVDTTETGDFSSCASMTNFRQEREYRLLSAQSQLNFAVNVYDDGNVLSIVTDAGAHGSHVAGITAAYQPDAPSTNGVAPGAQIVSVKIGDTRLGSMETSAGLIRGLRAVIDNKCDLINMSYGEAAAIANFGRFMDLAGELVTQHNVIFVSSAGNGGPALSTVGAPGGTSTKCIGVGAMVSPEMMELQYSMRGTVPSINYTWSSRGPTFDGDLGVSVSAPGGAITSVPNWTKARSMMMNGTSMSSPNCCGNLALLVSALKAQGIAYTPELVRMAIENSSAPVIGSDIFGLGHGLLQISAAYDLIASVDKEYPEFTVAISSDGSGSHAASARGVYWREQHQYGCSSDVIVQLGTKWPEDCDQRRRVDFQVNLAFVSSCDWVACSPSALLTAGGSHIRLNIDPTGLSYGAHYAEVRGYDVEKPELGPLIRVPITITKAEPVSAATGRFEYGRVPLGPGIVNRRFIEVPADATWADVVVRRVDSGESALRGSTGPSPASVAQGKADDSADDLIMGRADDRVDDPTARLVVLHAVQVVPHLGLRKSECEKYLRMRPGSEEVVSFAVFGQRTLELDIGQFWSSLGATAVEVDVRFQGIKPEQAVVHLDAVDDLVGVEVVAGVCDSRLKPAAELTHWEHRVQPKSAAISSLTDRDMVVDPSVVTYQLVLEYTFTLEAPESVTPSAGRVNGALYESPWSAMLLLVHDEQRRLVGTSDAFPSTLKLAAGTYTARLQVRHTDAKVLNTMRSTTLRLKRPLSKPVKVPVFDSLASAMLRKGSFGTAQLKAGTRRMVFFAAPSDVTLPKDCGDTGVLVGSVTYESIAAGVAGASKRPTGYDFVFHPAPRGADAPKPKTPGDEKSELQKIQTAIRDFELQKLKSLRGDDFKKAYKELSQAHVHFGDPAGGDEADLDEASELGALEAWLEHVDSDWACPDNDPAAVVQAADAVLAKIDQDALAEHFGMEVDSTNVGMLRMRAKMTAQRNTLLSALRRRARAALVATGIRSTLLAEGGEEATAVFESSMAQLRCWCDVQKAPECALLLIEAAMRNKQFGEALRLVSQSLAASKATKTLPSCPPTITNSAKAMYELRGRLLEQLDWGVWREENDKELVARFPSSLPLF